MTIAAVPRGIATTVSALTGLVGTVDERLAGPADALLHAAWSELAGATAGSDGSAAPGAGGGWAASREQARAAAVGEALERQSATTALADRLVTATARELGVSALQPARLRLFRDQQIAGTRYAQLHEDLRIRWAPATRLADGAAAWVPAQLVTLDPTVPAGEPLLTIPTSNGLACATGPEEASLRALLELVERDAFTLMWAARLSLPRLTWDGDATLGTFVRERLAPAGLRFTAVDLSAFLDVPVVLAVVSAPPGFSGPAALGAAASATCGDAVRRALAEAFAAFSAARAFVRNRPDRSFAADGSDLGSFSDRIHFYADPARAGALAFLTASPETRHVDDVRPLRGADATATLAALAQALADRGIDAYSCDCTAPDIAGAGLHVARVVAPALCPIDAAHTLRFLGVPRLLTGAWEAGLAPRPLRPEEVNSDPHPFP